MTAPLDLTAFHHGETLVFTLAAKGRDGEPLDSPGSATLTLWIGDTIGGDALLEFDAAPQVVLADEPTATWLVQVPFADYGATLDEGRAYFYNLTTTAPGDDPILQKFGRLLFNPAINWA